MAGKPFPANRRQGSPRISLFHEMRYERYCNECQHTRRLSPLRRASGEHPSALKRMPVRRRDTLRSLSPHIGIASLDDKGAPYGYCTDESAWAYRVPDAYAPNMPVSGVPWATEVESGPHPGSGECAEDFNNSLTSKETAMKTVISTSKAPAAIGPYSQAIRKGDTLYLSGQIGMVPATGELVSDDVKEQTAQALANMKAILAEAGATPADVTKVTVFIVDMAEFQIVNGVYSETFGTDAPARSCVAVAALPKGARVEIEAIAVL